PGLFALHGRGSQEALSLSVRVGSPLAGLLVRPSTADRLVFPTQARWPPPLPGPKEIVMIARGRHFSETQLRIAQVRMDPGPVISSPIAVILAPPRPVCTRCRKDFPISK